MATSRAEDPEPRYLLRGATPDDGVELLELARFLDSVNLPHDSAALRSSLQQSERSFSGTEGEPRRREYRFVVVDRRQGRIVGSSMILGQLGRRDAPYIFFDVGQEERYSQTLDRYFVHRVLTIGYSFNGPTELGGLVVHPDARRSSERLGLLVSYLRFLWLAMHREDFQDHLLAELMPPLEADGTSHLWEAVGRRFTGLDYREADRLSKSNKEFIRSLFPDGEIYVSLLPEQAQAVVGAVGRETRGVQRMLERIGFRYAQRVDPFDGGPHYVARTDAVEPVRKAAKRLVAIGGRRGGKTRRALVGVAKETSPYLLAAPVWIDADEDESASDAILTLDEQSAQLLEVQAGDSVWMLPLPG